MSVEIPHTTVVYEPSDGRIAHWCGYCLDDTYEHMRIGSVVQCDVCGRFWKKRGTHLDIGFTKWTWEHWWERWYRNARLP